MGDLINTSVLTDVLRQLEARFAEGDPITEMAAVQKNFRVFDPAKTVKVSFAELGIAGNWPCHIKWTTYLEKLSKYGSDRGMNGEERLIAAYRENLESSAPLPMTTITHDAEEDPRVTVSVRDTLIVISMPVCPIPTKPYVDELLPY
jgi:hypothetical protein